MHWSSLVALDSRLRGNERKNFREVVEAKRGGSSSTRFPALSGDGSGDAGFYVSEPPVGSGPRFPSFSLPLPFGRDLLAVALAPAG